MKRIIKIFTMVFFPILLTACAVSSEYLKTTSALQENHLDLAVIAYKQGRLGDAEPLLLKFLKRHPTHPVAWFQLGNVYYRIASYEAAMRAFDKAIQFDRDNIAAYYNQALTYFKRADLILMAGENTRQTSDPFYRKIIRLRKIMASRVKQLKSK